MAMRQVEIQARSVDEAVRLALEQMGRTRDQVDVEVLSGSETGSEDDEVLVRVTAREQLSGARIRVKLNGVEGILHRPHHGNTLDKSAVRHLREYLAHARCTPSQYEQQ